MYTNPDDPDRRMVYINYVQIFRDTHARARVQCLLLGVRRRAYALHQLQRVSSSTPPPQSQPGDQLRQRHKKHILTNSLFPVASIDGLVSCCVVFDGGASTVRLLHMWFIWFGRRGRDFECACMCVFVVYAPCGRPARNARHEMTGRRPHSASIQPAVHVMVLDWPARVPTSMRHERAQAVRGERA